jgi:tetratricopeptide (TPR) repeat protein
MPVVRAEAKEALSLDPSESGPHFLLGAVAAAYEYDWKRAAEHFAIATAGTSVSSEAHWAYASLYLQPLGRFQEAVFQMERAVEHDPLNPFWRGVLTSHLTHAQLYDRAIEHFTLGEAYATMGRWPDAVGALEQSHRIAPQDALGIGMLAGALVRVGDKTRAERLIREMGEVPRPIFGRVLYHVLCSETEPAADWYERAIEQRDPFALVFANGPLGSTFRQSARWPKLARMMNLPLQQVE